jgi:ATP-dependent Clp protease ATP-binding subunit ClpX
LFICAGAFSGLDKIISKRGTGSSIGFGADIKDSKKEKTNIIQKVEPEDIISFGLIPELVGRLPVVATLDELTKEDLVRILTEPKNSIIKQYTKLFELDDTELEFDKPALEEISKRAISRKTGARGLRAIIEKILLETMFEIPSKDDSNHVLITQDIVKNSKDPEINTKKKKVKTKQKHLEMLEVKKKVAN